MALLRREAFWCLVHAFLSIESCFNVWLGHFEVLRLRAYYEVCECC